MPRKNYTNCSFTREIRPGDGIQYTSKGNTVVFFLNLIFFSVDRRFLHIDSMLAMLRGKLPHSEQWEIQVSRQRNVIDSLYFCI